MRKNHKKFLALLLTLTMLLSAGGTALAAQVTGTEDPSVSVSIDGEDVDLKDANGTELDPVMINDSTYLPVRAIAEALGLNVNWDGASNTVQLSAPGGAAAPSSNSRAAVPAMAHLTGNGRYGFGEGYLLGYLDNGIYTFKNIKYGTAERFKHSVPNKEYGTAEHPSFAMSNGPVAPQSDTRTASNKTFGNAATITPSDSDMFSVEADCLNLNVWTNTMNANAKKPVLVFMHGGGYASGSSIELKSYNGNYLADYGDLVFVSVNARLNDLGYLDLAAIGGDRNLAISDMVLSLEWVKDNIAQFGGDPDNVTILGQSGGGGKVTALASAPKALEENLFQKVVYVSGALANARTEEEQDARALEIVETVKTAQDFINYVAVHGAELGLGVTESSTLAQVKDIAAKASNQVVFQYLQNVNYDVLLELIPFSSGYGLTADGEYFDKAGSFAADGLNETARNYTYMMGFAWGEASGRSTDGGIVRSDPSLFVSNMTEAQQRAAVESWLENRVGGYDETKAAFEKAYPGHKFYDVCALQIPGGMRHNSDVFKNMAARLKDGNQVYNYMSAYTAPMFGGMTMVHTLDLTYFFHSLETSPYQIHGDEANAWKVADTMASALAAFCATGNPSTPNLRVEPYTAEQGYTVVFDVESRCVPADFDADLLALIAEKDAG